MSAQPISPISRQQFICIDRLISGYGKGGCNLLGGPDLADDDFDTLSGLLLAFDLKRSGGGVVCGKLSSSPRLVPLILQAVDV